MRLLKQLITLAGFAIAPPLQAENQLNWQVSHTQNRLDQQAVFAHPAEQLGIDEGRSELQLQFDGGYGNLHWSLRGSLHQADHSEGVKGFVDELSYDLFVDGWEFSLGRRRIEWGIGYAIRPLDVIAQGQRQHYQTSYESGVDLVEANWFGLESSWQFVALYRPADQQELPDAGGAELAARYYRLWGDVDLHAIVHGVEGGAHGLGGGLSWVVGDALELHLAGLIRRKAHHWAQDDYQSLTEITRLRPIHNPLLLLMGGNWSHEGGITLMVEGWYDERGYSSHTWEQLQQLNQQKQLIPDPALQSLSRLSDSRHYLAPSLLRQNLFFRLSQDNETIDPSLSIQWTPEDGGSVLTLQIDSQILNDLTATLALRQFGGTRGSAYGESGLGQQIYLGLEGQWEIY